MTTSIRPDRPAWLEAAVASAISDLIARHGEAQRARATRGVAQVADFWRAEDGDAAAFAAFVATHFAGDQEALDTMFTRFERLLEQIEGRMSEVGRELRAQSELDLGPVQPYDEIFAAYEPGAHLLDDFFANKLAFVVLLNFPLTTLQERLGAGADWSRREWAEVRLAQRFSKRIPAEVNQAIAESYAKADQYIADYNIWMHHVLDEKGRRLFPAKMRLLSHWNLRDQIKADYSETGEQALARQRAIQKVMERIVTQTIPDLVINHPGVDWNPYTNAVEAAPLQTIDGPIPARAADKPLSGSPEPDTRYAVLLADFRAMRLVDPYSPTAPTFIARRFDEQREIPEERVRAMFEQVLTSPLAPRVAKIIRARLGRPLEPFDIWYNGFRPRGAYTEAQLDEICRRKYPTADAYRDDMPRMLAALGFPPERAAYLAAHIAVDPARGSGHALGANLRGEKARLRTRVGAGGMDYKGYNIAVHEMGHTVEQTLSLNDVDHWFLRGVPNNAFTEALAYVCQDRDLELLGLTRPDARSAAWQTIGDYWMTYEIAAVSLVDMAIWHWMYDHPDATPVALRQAAVAIAQETWNRYCAPIFGVSDVALLGIYSQMINAFLYMPDYAIGHLISRQIEQRMHEAGAIGPEFERMCRYGSLVPDLWMMHATGSPIGAESLLAATEQALGVVGE